MNSNLSVTDDRGRSMLRLFSGTRAPSSVPGFPARARAAARAHSRLAAALRRHAHGGRRSPKLPSVPSLIPSSFATRAIGRDVSITIFTASSLNSGEKLFFGRGNYFTFPDVHPIGWTVRKLRGTPVGAVAELGLVGAGGQGGGDVVPGGSVVAGFQDVLGEHALGLAGEAGQQGDGGEGVAEPFVAAFGELVEGVVDEVVGVVAAARPGRGRHCWSPWSWRAAGMRPGSRFFSR